MTEAAQRSLHAAIQKLLAHHPADNTSERVEATCEPVKVLELLSRGNIAQKFYWSDRRRTFEWMGLGIALQETGLPDSDVPYFGAISFDGSQTNFVLPIVEIRSTPEGAEISINLVGGAEKARELLQALLEKNESAPALPRAASESRVTSFERFRENFVQCKKLLSENALDKIVLANAHDFYFDEDIDPIWLLRYLDEKSPHTYRFLFQMKEGEAFVGASPEQLFQRNGRRIESEAQAGTKPRGKNPSEDSSLAFELLESQKEFIEHDLVIQDIERGLAGLCVDSGWIDQRQVIKLSHVQHLRSRFGGILKPDVSDSEIVQTLHPTAAVCGGPKEVAKKWIHALEDFDRGLYCGAIGMISKERTELAVGLRSALVKAQHVRIFAGAGLVSGSRAEDEWDEIDSKMRLYHNALGCPRS